MQPTRPGRPRARTPRWVIVVLSALALAALLVVALMVAIGPIVRSRVQAAAERRALDVRYEGMAYRFSRAELRDVTITPKGSSAVVVRAELLDARIHGMSPSWLILPRADVTATGGVDDVVRALGPVRRADETLPDRERVPIDVAAGTLRWKQPLGSGSALSFDTLTAAVRPKEARTTAKLGKGKLELPHLSLGGLAVEVTRVTVKGVQLDVHATLDGEDGHVSLDVHRRDEATDVALEVESFSLGAASPKMIGLDLSRATVDGSMDAERSAAGAIRSSGKLTFGKLGLPPVKVGPLSLALGGTVRVSWKGSPKKGAPGTMLLDDAKVEVTLGGRTRVVQVGGEISVGPAGEGPYTVKLDWLAGPFACADIAGDLGGPLLKGLAGGAIGGNVDVRGTIRGDITEPSALDHKLTILEACKVDVGKGVGDLLKSLPF